MKKSKTATIITPVAPEGVGGYLEAHGIEPTAKVTLFKRVSKDLQTQEGTRNETLWVIGSSLEVSNWNTVDECGPGKFHACATPYFCDEFRDTEGDRYIAVEVAKEDLHAHKNPNYPHKIAFRRGTVLYECDRFGEKV